MGLKQNLGRKWYTAFIAKKYKGVSFDFKRPWHENKSKQKKGTSKLNPNAQDALKLFQQPNGKLKEGVELEEAKRQVQGKLEKREINSIIQFIIEGQ